MFNAHLSRRIYYFGKAAVPGIVENANISNQELQNIILSAINDNQEEVKEVDSDGDSDTESQIADNIFFVDENEEDNFQLDNVANIFESSEKKNSKYEDILLPRVVVNVTDYMRKNPVVKEIIKTINDRSSKEFPKNSSDLFDSNCQNGATIQQFCRMFSEVSVTHGFTKAAVNDVLKLIRDTTSVKVPVGEKNSLPHSGPITGNSVDSYLEEDKKGMVIDVCRNGCMAFFGKLMDKNGNPVIGKHGHETDYRCALQCHVCLAPRLAPCSHAVCKKHRVPYSHCNPYVAGEREKGFYNHSLTYRKPLQSVYYRSIIAKLIDLYLLSCFDGFEDILHYRTQRFTRKGHIIDVHDGMEIKKHYKEMDDNFKKVEAEFIENNPGCILEQCSLGLTLFYDGVVNFKRKADSMWPMMCSVLDCNPSHRSKPGLGVFLTALHNMAMGSNAEKFLMKKCLTKELAVLERGVLFSFVDPKSEKKRYVFLQARCMYAHLDTKALEKFAMVQASGSKHGCPLCNHCKGVYRTSLKKTVYISCREGLHQHHYCRFVGEELFVDRFDDTGQLIETAEERQENYYDGSATSQADIAEKLGNVYLNYTAKTYPMKRNKVDIADPKVHVPDGVVPVWYNMNWPKELFMNAMRFPHPDTRPQKVHTRTTDSDYFKAGDEAVSLRNIYMANLLRLCKTLPKKPKDCSVRGVHDICPLIEELDTVPFSFLNWDLMHQLSNVSGYKFKLYKGERFSKEGARRLAVAQNKHPHLRYVNIKLPWQTAKGEQDLMDAVMNSIIVPSYYHADYAIKYPFQQTGYLKSKHHIVFMSVFESYLLSFSDIADDYKHLSGRFAEDICALLNPCISRETLLTKTIPSIDETRALFLGMFPDSEQVFVFHQIIDIARHILNYGHVRGLMCFAGERFNYFLSDCISKGGVHYMKTMYHRYVLKETFAMKYFADDAIDNVSNDGLYSDFALRLLGDADKDVYVCSPEESNLFCDKLYNLLQTQEIDDLHMISSFYRLYTAYKFIERERRYKNIDKGFWKWIQNIDNEKDIPIEHRSYSKWITGFVDNLYFYDNELINSGHVYRNDFRGIVCDLLPVIKFKTFRSAVIKGVKFKCRGVKNMHNNDISSNWKDMAQSNSWCQINKYDVVEEDVFVDNSNDDGVVISKIRKNSKKRAITKTKRVNTTSIYGQLDFCVRFNMSSDPLLDGVAFAHVTTRHTESDHENEGSLRRHCRIKMDPITGHGPNPKMDFVCLNYVQSTGIALSALSMVNGNLLPHLSSQNFSSFTRAFTDLHKGVYAPVNSKIHSIYLIKLHPERVNFEYGSILKDRDGTKTKETDRKEDTLFDFSLL